MSLDRTISELQGRMARRRNLIAELESDYDLLKARAVATAKRAHHWKAREVRWAIKPLVADQRLDKRIFDSLCTQRTTEMHTDWVPVRTDPITGKLHALADTRMFTPGPDFLSRGMGGLFDMLFSGLPKRDDLCTMTILKPRLLDGDFTFDLESNVLSPTGRFPAYKAPRDNGMVRQGSSLRPVSLADQDYSELERRVLATEVSTNHPTLSPAAAWPYFKE